MQILIIRLALAAILIFCFYFSEYIYACKLEKMKEKKKKVVNIIRVVLKCGTLGLPTCVQQVSLILNFNG